MGNAGFAYDGELLREEVEGDAVESSLANSTASPISKFPSGADRQAGISRPVRVRVRGYDFGNINAFSRVSRRID